MADNPFKRYLDAGIAFTALTQSKAEAIVKDLVSVGEVQTEQAQAAVADLLERSRKNSERLIDTVRAEVHEQVVALGLVSQAEIARLERRIENLTGIDTQTAVRKVAGRKAAATRKGNEADEAVAQAAAAVKGAATTARQAAADVAGSAGKAAADVAGSAEQAARTTKASAKRAATTSKRAATKKATATKATAKKATAKQAPAKKAPAKKRAAKKAPAKKTAAKKTAARKTAAKKTAAKKTAAKKQA